MARREDDDDREDADLALPEDSEAEGTDAPVEDEDLDDDEPGSDDHEPSVDDDAVEAADDDADDESDDDADDDDDAPASPRRRSLGPTLLTLGGGVWLIAAALRCGAPEPGPALSVSPDAATPAEPGISAADDPPELEPADDQPETEPVDDQPEPAAADGADRPEPDEVDDQPLPLPPPEDWATDLTVPDKVSYTIRRGGSIKNVANLFTIFHHEITALNPGVTLEQELPPDSKVVIYERDEDTSSESVGFPSDGSLEGAVPMVEGPGRVLKMKPEKSWGTAHTVALLDQILRQWAKRGKIQPVLVGNMSARKGGRLEPHSTHQSGRDVDIGYMQKLPDGEELNWRTMTKQNLDAAETWTLLELLRSSGQVEVIFIDTSIQKLLYDHAVANDTVPEADLPRWLQYPRGHRRALVQHVKGHVDHIHVRFRCQSHESRCKSRAH